MAWVRTVFVSADGKPRSGWAIAVFVAVTLAAFLGPIVALTAVGGPITPGDRRAMLAAWIEVLGTLLATWVGCRMVRQPFGAAGFADPDPGRKALLGAAVTMVLVTVVSVVPYLLGKEGLGGPQVGARTLVSGGAFELALFAPQSAAEEIFLRGFVLQQFRRGIGTVAAVLVTGVIFGVLHLFNANSSWIAAFNIALVGIWLGIVVVRTGSLWMTIGMHIAWNWFEGFVWGQPVSGYAMDVTLVHRTSGDSLFWTGGAFGPEASVLTALLLVALIGISLVAPLGRLAARTSPG
jgi:membrane protease YdiL (CAAX protease family)